MIDDSNEDPTIFPPTEKEQNVEQDTEQPADAAGKKGDEEKHSGGEKDHHKEFKKEKSGSNMKNCPTCWFPFSHLVQRFNT